MTSLRFSLRTLAILVTLVCAYFGAWEATKRYGVPQPETKGSEGTLILSAESQLPLIVSQTEMFPDGRRRRQYLWLGVVKIRLPGESPPFD
jgi:hypothetical protein